MSAIATLRPLRIISLLYPYRGSQVVQVHVMWDGKWLSSWVFSGTSLVTWQLMTSDLFIACSVLARSPQQPAASALGSFCIGPGQEAGPKHANSRACAADSPELNHWTAQVPDLLAYRILTSALTLNLHNNKQAWI